MKRNKVLLFYNPQAGNGLFGMNLDSIIEKFQKKKLFVIPVRSDRRGLLNEVLKEINPNEFKKIIVAGGDGTINMAVNGMIAHHIDLPLAIFPAGTANDFAYYFDLPGDIDGMIKIALEENYTYADVGKANDKYFINVAAMGFLVDVSQKTDPDVKNTLGVISYYLKGVSEIPNLRPITVKITSEEFTFEDKIYFMLVMNGRSAGGFKRIAPSAKVNDGLLDVMLFKELPILELAPLLINVMTGQHQDNKNVISFQTNKLHIEADQDVNTDIDGEKGDGLPLDIEVLPKRLRINTLLPDMEGSRW